LRRGKLERLTRDHSLVEEMRRKGQITDAQAEDHPQRSIITRALGPEPEVEVDLQTVPAAPGDVFLLCSDGLTSMVGDREIGDVLREHAGDLEEAARALVQAANRVGGEDNITVICFEVGDADPGAQTEAMDLPTEENALPDEDTLSGLDGPAPIAAESATTAVRPPAEVARQAPDRGPRWGRLALLLLVLAVLVAAALYLLDVL
jgi:protein phosphatase